MLQLPPIFPRIATLFTYSPRFLPVPGTDAAPEIATTSNPRRPQDEVLALILFGKTTAQLSAFEAVQLAAAVAQLTGGGGGGVLDFARNALGVDVLRVGDAEDGAPTVQAGKYIAKDVFVGVEQGAAAGTSAGRAEERRGGKG